jgi:dihydroflavonol-4-reductase
MIVVTGGTGLLGGHLLLELAKTDSPVRVLIRKNSAPEKVLSVWKHYSPEAKPLISRFEWLPVDMTNMAEISEAIESAIQVYHCAGFVSFRNSFRRDLINVNVHITSSLVNACLNLPSVKLLHVSSIAAIKNTTDGTPSTELSGWSTPGLSLYSRTKTSGELEVWRGIAEGLNAVIINPSVILGVGNWQQSSVRIFDVLYRGLKYYSNGVTGYVDARDVARAMVLLMNSNISGERYILNAANLSFREVFEKIATALNVLPPSHCASQHLLSLAWRAEWFRSLITGSEPRITRVSARSADEKHSYSSGKFCAQFDFSFNDIDDTIREVASFYLRDIAHRAQ